ncbi:MAG: hypothetical protein GY804_02480 [Alphaproteobacteria bacterium]|nr:hypothetical protein [Alphaproteobacteria bacterium]
MKKLSIVLLLIFCFMLFTAESCNEEVATAEKKQTDQTNKVLDEINRQVGMPNLSNFQQKKLMKMVFELCDKEDLVCYAYIKSDYQGKLMFIGKCVGFGVPFSAQYTNPMKGVDVGGRHKYAFTTIPQADPNGLYMPTSSSATWLMMIDPKNNTPRPVYLEPEIVVSPFPLH